MSLPGLRASRPDGALPPLLPVERSATIFGTTTLFQAPYRHCWHCCVGRRRSLDPAWLWLWCQPVAAALIRPLAWEFPYAAGVALKSKKKKKKTERERPPSCGNQPALAAEFHSVLVTDKNFWEGRSRGHTPLASAFGGLPMEPLL